MCGIFCAVARHGCPVVPSPTLKERLLARGPDASKETLLTVRGASVDESVSLTLFSTVLSLRGRVTTEQPFQHHASDSVLCWNGEAWNIRRQRLHETGNDTSAVHELLCSALCPLPQSETRIMRDSAVSSARTVSRTLAQISGPYAFVYYHKPTSTLFFGRDFLGRRSLLWKVGQHGELLLSSISDGPLDGSWAEVDADGIYCIDLNFASDAAAVPISAESCAILSDSRVSKVPYTFSQVSDDTTSVIPRLLLNRNIPQIHTLDENSPSVSMLGDLLQQSLFSRVRSIPIPPRQPPDQSAQQNARIAVLFSGGLDCTLLARLCHDLLPLEATIDLLNVAFQNPRAHRNVGDAAYELCPDRTTGRASHAELCRVCPGRIWRFVAIDIPYTEYQDHRAQIIDLMSPHNTEMDLSIASALYFAARGKGQAVSLESGELVPYTTEARVLLSGLGADELFAGYTRHATAFRRQGIGGLLDELDLDVGRLGKRNLGRDDRVISHWAREARFPFLDEAVVQWALNCPVAEKCDFGAVKTGVGAVDENSCAAIESGKKVLRCLAWKLGMKGVAQEKKRAIQFGARTAKMETGKTKGTSLLL